MSPYPTCPDCIGTPGNREVALGWIDGEGNEHRRVWLALCPCEAGDALKRGPPESDNPKREPLAALPRIDCRDVIIAWRAALRRRGLTEVGVWVTDRDCRRLPVEATTTPAELARMAEEKARRAKAPRRTGTASPASDERPASRVESRPASSGRSWGDFETVPPPDDRDRWEGAADGDEYGMGDGL